MKKGLKLVLVSVLLLPLFLININASSVPYAWIVGGEKVNVDEPNQAKTATLEKDGKTVTLHLKNYNGGGLKLECYGTGQSDMVFVIDLSGNNVITADNIGLDFGTFIQNGAKVEFKGTGDLTINAAKPISYESFTAKAYINPSNNQFGEVKEVAKEQETTTTTTESTKKDEVKEESITTNDDEKTTSSDTIKETNVIDLTTILLIVCGSLLFISIIVIIVLIIKLGKKKTEIQ